MNVKRIYGIEDFDWLWRVKDYGLGYRTFQKRFEIWVFVGAGTFSY